MTNSLIKKLRRWPNRMLLITLLIVVVIFGGVAIARHIYNDNLRPLNSTIQKTINVNIPAGASLKDIAHLLKQQKIIRSEWAFTQYVRDKNASNDLKAGTYELSPSQSVQEIVAVITDGKIAANLITILPGQRLSQIKKAFVTSGFSQEATDKAFNPDLYKDSPALVDKPAGAGLEGYIYPESFQKTSSTTAEEIIRESLNEMQKRLTPDIRAAFVAENLTTHQAITLASIVQQEGYKPDDMNKIAQVFLSRIKNGMPLGSDVTAVYGALNDGLKLPDNTAQAATIAIAHDSPYNTRIHTGLPPGPISNVTFSALQAVAHPANTNYLYFVAGDDGTVYFSATQEEHDAQVAQYCHKLCQ